MNTQWKFTYWKERFKYKRVTVEPFKALKFNI